MKIWASQGLRQNDALWILWVLEKLKETEYSTNKSVIQNLLIKKNAARSAPATALKTCARRRYNAAPEGAEGQPAEGAFKNGASERPEVLWCWR